MSHVKGRRRFFSVSNLGSRVLPFSDSKIAADFVQKAKNTLPLKKIWPKRLKTSHLKEFESRNCSRIRKIRKSGSTGEREADTLRTGRGVYKLNFSDS